MYNWVEHWQYDCNNTSHSISTARIIYYQDYAISLTNMYLVIFTRRLDLGPFRCEPLTSLFLVPTLILSAPIQISLVIFVSNTSIHQDSISCGNGPALRPALKAL